MSKRIAGKRCDTRIVTEVLEVALTEKELKEASKVLAESFRAKNALEAEIDTFKAQKKAEITKLDGVISLNAGLVNNEKEFRAVECEIRFEWERGNKVITRMDTGEEMRTEPITNAERQQFFPDSAPVAVGE